LLKTAKTKEKAMVLGAIVLIGSLGFMIQFVGSTRLSTEIIHVACVGDSITEGSGYPSKLQAMLGNAFFVGNFGVTGSAVSSDSNIPYINQSAFLRGKSFRPSIVIIMLGTNDAAESLNSSTADFTTDYRNLIKEYQSLECNPEIWLVNPPPLFENNLNLSNTNLLRNIIPCIEQVAVELDLKVIDVNAAFEDCPEYFGDGVHPNTEGSTLIARTVCQTMASKETQRKDNYQLVAYFRQKL